MRIFLATPTNSEPHPPCSSSLSQILPHQATPYPHRVTYFPSWPNPSALKTFSPIEPRSSKTEPNLFSKSVPPNRVAPIRSDPHSHSAAPFPNWAVPFRQLSYTHFPWDKPVPTEPLPSLLCRTFPRLLYQHPSTVYPSTTFLHEPHPSIWVTHFPMSHNIPLLPSWNCLFWMRILLGPSRDSPG